jgi:hypothetical protein
METSILIPKVIEEITKDIGYCGSCMGGCDSTTKFICLGKGINDINSWIQSHGDLIDKWEIELYADL